MQAGPGLLLPVLSMYESGLRLGEATHLHWGDVAWGKGEDDASRHILIQRSANSGRVGLPKSGQKRKVGLSRRLRRVLLERFLAEGRPPLDHRVVKAPWPRQFRLALLEACKVARIQAHTSKDFRDTFASVLVTNGINLTWVSRQLGHGSVRTTEKHYAMYMDEEGYRNPLQVRPGEVPNDLFARLDGWNQGRRQQTASKLQEVI